MFRVWFMTFMSEFKEWALNSFVSYFIYSETGELIAKFINLNTKVAKNSGPIIKINIESMANRYELTMKLLLIYSNWQIKNFHI